MMTITITPTDKAAEIDPTDWTWAQCHAYLTQHGHDTDHGTAADATDEQQLYAVRDLVREVAGTT